MDSISTTITRGTVTVEVKIYSKDSAWKRLYIAVKNPMGKVTDELDVNLLHLDSFIEALTTAKAALDTLEGGKDGQ